MNKSLKKFELFVFKKIAVIIKKIRVIRIIRVQKKSLLSLKKFVLFELFVFKKKSLLSLKNPCYSSSKKIAVAVKKNRRFRRERSGGKKSKKQQEKGQKRFAYLCIFALVFSGVLKEPNLRFESASLTSSLRLFDELIKAL